MKAENEELKQRIMEYESMPLLREVGHG
jgi:hypothetical protein